MENGFFLITGTSRGIGEALAQKILDQGHTVLGLSRSRAERLKSTRYRHVSFDLADTLQISRIMETVNEIVADRDFDFICLVNNASTAEPGGYLERCQAAEIESHIKVGLIAPMILTSLFLSRFADSPIRKKVAFISSGAAFSPFPGDSIYCSAKAGLNMLAQCVGLEQKDKPYGFEVVAIGPGMVDTFLQQVARSKSNDEYPSADYCRQAYEQGMLDDPAIVADRIFQILANKYEPGQYVKAYEV